MIPVTVSGTGARDDACWFRSCIKVAGSLLSASPRRQVNDDEESDGGKRRGRRRESGD